MMTIHSQMYVSKWIQISHGHCNSTLYGKNFHHTKSKDLGLVPYSHLKLTWLQH